MARPTGFEPETSASGGQRSIQLSYGRLAPLRGWILRIPSPLSSAFLKKMRVWLSFAHFAAYFSSLSA